MTLQEYEHKRADIFAQYREKVEEIHRKYASAFTTAVCCDRPTFDDLSEQYDDEILKAADRCKDRLADLSREFLR